MLVVYAELSIDDADREIIDAVRRQHDPQYAIVAAHFTFVFPLTGIPIGVVISHAKRTAATLPPVTFRLARALAVPDAFAPRSHVFLLPVLGEDELRTFHDRLYSGPIAPKLHPKVAYHPHVTVGAFEIHEDAERLASKLTDINISGLVTSLIVGELVGGQVIARERIPLVSSSC